MVSILLEVFQSLRCYFNSYKRKPSIKSGLSLVSGIKKLLSRLNQGEPTFPFNVPETLYMG